MDLRIQFVHDIASEYVSTEVPLEKEYLDILITEITEEYVEFGEIDRDQLFGLGVDEIVQAMQSPAIVLILSSVWTSLIAPLIKDIASKIAIERLDRSSEVNEQVTKRLSTQKLKEYIDLKVRNCL